MVAVCWLMADGVGAVSCGVYYHLGIPKTKHTDVHCILLLLCNAYSCINFSAAFGSWDVNRHSVSGHMNPTLALEELMHSNFLDGFTEPLGTVCARVWVYVLVDV